MASIKALPKVIKDLISKVEALGRKQEKEETKPVRGFLGIFERVAAGEATATLPGKDSKQKVAYGVSTRGLDSEDAEVVMVPKTVTVFFIGTKGVETVTDLLARVSTTVSFWQSQGLTEEGSVQKFLGHTNHGYNISQRSNVRPSDSQALGVKPINAMTSDAVKSGVDPDVLQAEYAKLLEKMKKSA